MANSVQTSKAFRLVFKGDIEELELFISSLLVDVNQLKELALNLGR